MNARAKTLLVAIMLVCMIPTAGLAITAYSQNFEGLDDTSSVALSADGWLVYGNVFDTDMVYVYGYGAFPAPNHALAFSQIVLDQSGPDQGAQSLVVFSDYENVDHASNYFIESNVFHEQTITLADVGSSWTFVFDAKRGNIEGSTTAIAFIKTLNPAAGWATTNFITAEMTAIPDTWGHYYLNITIDASLENQRIQFGFSSTATLYEGSAIYYDNIEFKQGLSDVPVRAGIADATMRQNYPNPFNPMTRIEFSLKTAGTIDISVFDLAGRRIATVFQGRQEAGDHHVTWNGKTDKGLSAPAGQYRYVLKTETGMLSKSMVLLK